MFQRITFNGQEYEYVKPYYLLKVGSINLIKAKYLIQVQVLS